MPLSKSVFLLVGWLLCYQTLADEPIVDADVFSLKVFPAARAIYQEHRFVSNYCLALGAFSKTEKGWQLAQTQRLSGDLNRITFALPAGVTAAEGVQFYQQQLAQYRARLLFHCSSHACGSSSSWANRYFHVSLLYGPERYQSYSVYRFQPRANVQATLVIYVMQQGEPQPVSSTGVQTYVQYELLQQSLQHE